MQANNDIANQGIIQKSKKFDQSGQGTVGIITKADPINAGTERRIAALAKAQDATKLELGYFLLKNRLRRSSLLELRKNSGKSMSLLIWQICHHGESLHGKQTGLALSRCESFYSDYSA